MSYHFESGTIEIACNCDQELIIIGVYSGEGDELVGWASEHIGETIWDAQLECIDRAGELPTKVGVYNLSGTFQVSWSDDGQECYLKEGKWSTPKNRGDRILFYGVPIYDQEIMSVLN